MRFLFTCGGTAGHINPALAVAGRLKKLMPDSEFLFVGSGRELENRLVPMAGFELVNIRVSGLSRGFAPKDIKANIQAVFDLISARGYCKKIIKEFKPDVAIGTGGYVCYPVLSAASSAKVPTAVHESNAVPGLTTKMLSSFVDRVMVAFEGMENSYNKPDRVIVTGTPVRDDFASMTKESAKRALGVDDRPLVVSFWGSLGASKMNQIMADFIQLNARNHSFMHIHATGGGEVGFRAMEAELKRRNTYDLGGSDTDLRPYIDNMGTVMSAADIVLCRAGASTIAELTAMGKPAILVPSPNVTNDHQTVNARALHDCGGGKMITEAECTGKILYDEVCALLKSSEDMQKMSECSKKLGISDAADRIVSEILSLVKKD